MLDELVHCLAGWAVAAGCAAAGYAAAGYAGMNCVVGHDCLVVNRICSPTWTRCDLLVEGCSVCAQRQCVRLTMMVEWCFHWNRMM